MSTLHSSDDSYSDDGLYSSMKFVLPVGKHPEGDPNEPPINGLEYLRRVRLQTSSLPCLVRVEPPLPLTPSSTLLNSSKSNLDSLDSSFCSSVYPPFQSDSSSISLPSISFLWAELVCYQFQQLQTDILEYRRSSTSSSSSSSSTDLTNITSPTSFPPFPTHLHSLTSWSQFFQTTYTMYPCLPLSILIPFPHSALLNYLSWHLSFFTLSFSLQQLQQRCQSIYTLCLAIDPLLTANEISILRDIGKQCHLLWWQHPQATELQPALAMILAILVHPFGQLDLCEFKDMDFIDDEVN